MCLHPITKANTYGKKGEWQTCEEFRDAFMKTAEELNIDIELISEETIDDVVVVLEKMGHVIMNY